MTTFTKAPEPKPQSHFFVVSDSEQPRAICFSLQAAFDFGEQFIDAFDKTGRTITEQFKFTDEGWTDDF